MPDSSPPESRIDERLASRLRTGDPDALGECYEQYKRMVYGFCLKVLHDSALAEDATQNTFLKIRDRIDGLKDPLALRSWIIRIAHNEALQSLRRENWYSGDTTEEEQTAANESPAESAERVEENQIVDLLLARLSPEYREVLVLREYLDFSYAQIADVTGDSLSAVKSKIHKARRRLTELFRTQFGEGSRP